MIEYKGWAFGKGWSKMTRSQKFCLILLTETPNLVYLQSCQQMHRADSYSGNVLSCRLSSDITSEWSNLFELSSNYNLIQLHFVTKPTRRCIYLRHIFIIHDLFVQIHHRKNLLKQIQFFLLSFNNRNRKAHTFSEGKVFYESCLLKLFQPKHQKGRNIFLIFSSGAKNKILSVFSLQSALVAYD